MGESVADMRLPMASLSLSLARYLAQVRAVTKAHSGSGYVAGYGCRRALQEAFSGLFFSQEEQQS